MGLFDSYRGSFAFMQWMNPYCATKNVDFEEHTEWTLAIQLEVGAFDTYACHCILKLDARIGDIRI